MTTVPPLRILTVANVPPDPNSGAAGTVWHTNVALRELGHEVDEIWADDLGPRRIKHGNLHSLLEQPRAYRREVLKAVSEKEYDVVMMSQPQAYLAAKALKQTGFGGLVINRSHGVELRADSILPEWHRKLGVRESRFPWLTSALRKLLHRQWDEVIKWCDGFVVGCRLDQQFLVNEMGIPNHIVRAIPHGVDDAFLSSESPVLNCDRLKKLLHVGQCAFFKGSHILIQIVNRILVEDSSLSFTWVCSKSHHSWIRQQLVASIRTRVNLVHWMSREALIDVYDQHGIFIFPSLFEGFGKAPFEAMSRGCCVIASREGGMLDHIESNVNGLVCDRGEILDFVSSVKNLLQDDDMLAHISRAGRKSAKALTWKTNASGVACVCIRLMRNSDNGHTRKRPLSTSHSIHKPNSAAMS